MEIFLFYCQEAEEGDLWKHKFEAIERKRKEAQAERNILQKQVAGLSGNLEASSVSSFPFSINSCLWWMCSFGRTVLIENLRFGLLCALIKFTNTL